MGKMSELDARKQEIATINDSQDSDLEYQIVSEADVILTAKHQHVSEIPTPQDVVKSRNGFDYVDEGYMRWRLNQHYPCWSWEVLKYETLGDKAIVVHGRLKIMDEGIPRSFDSVAAHRIAQARSGSGYVDLGNDLKAANSDAFKVAVNRLCNVADDVYRKQYVDNTLSQNQYDKMLLLMSQLDVQEAEKVDIALRSGKITKDNYDKVIVKLEKGVKDE